MKKSDKNKTPFRAGLGPNPFEITHDLDALFSNTGRPFFSNRGLVAWGVGVLLSVLAIVVVSIVNDAWISSLFFNVFMVFLLMSGLLVFAFFSRQKIKDFDGDLLKNIVEMTGVGRVVTDDIGRIVSANEAYRALFEGKSPSPHRIAKIRVNARPIIDEMLATLNEQGEAHNIIPNRPGRVEPSLYVKVVKSGRYQVWGFDPIDKERQLLDRVELLQGRIATVLDYFSLGLVILDEAGYVRFMNTSARNQLGKDERNSIILHETELEGWDALSVVEHSKLYGDRFVIPVQLDKMSGPVGRVCIITPPSHVGDTSSDIDVAFLERVFGESPVGMASVDQSGDILAFNPIMQKMLKGMGFHALSVGDNFSDYWHGEELNKIMTGLAEAYEGHAPKSGVEVVCDKGDAYRFVNLFFGASKGVDGRTISLFMIDTTDQKQLEIQFSQAQKMQAVGQLAGGVAHDFNNLLTAIIGFSDMVLARYSPRDPSFADLMQIKQNANRAANLVRQLLAFSRQQTLKTEILSVSDMLDETSDLIRRLLGDSVEFRLVHGRNVAPIRFDVGQFEQVIINMAVNARDAMEDGGGVLTIRTGNISAAESVKQGYSMMRRGEYILIEIEDTGSGIPKDNLDKIFEPFFTTKPVGKGTGLGLSMVYGIVKQSGGYVFAESKVGRGTVFKIYLPKYKSIIGDVVNTSKSEKIEIVRDLTGKETILFVEDEDAVRIFAAKALKNKGYMVLEASSGEMALEILRAYKGHIDLIISDLMMPHMDGSVVVEKAQAIRPNTKVIMISGYAEDAIRKKVDNVAYHFLPKPFSLDELARSVRSTLDSNTDF